MIVAQRFITLKKSFMGAYNHWLIIDHKLEQRAMSAEFSLPYCLACPNKVSVEDVVG